MGRVIFDGLAPAQRAALAAIQTDPRARRAVTASTEGPRARLEADGAVVLELPGLALRCTPNSRRHPLETARLRRRERAAVLDLLRTLPPSARGVGPWAVSIVRRGPRALDDDNATASAKGVRDAVAQWLEADDGGPRVRWTVSQERGPFGVAVRIEAAK